MRAIDHPDMQWLAMLVQSGLVFVARHYIETRETWYIGGRTFSPAELQLVLAHLNMLGLGPF